MIAIVAEWLRVRRNIMEGRCSNTCVVRWYVFCTHKTFLSYVPMIKIAPPVVREEFIRRWSVYV